MPGKKYPSSDGKFYLTIQADKNLVVRRTADDGYVWGLVDRPGVDYKRTASARMTAAGKFEVVDASGTPIWSIPDSPVPGGVMNLSPDGTPHVSAAGTAETFKMPIPPGTTLQQGERYVSSDGKHFLIFQNDNNLVIYRAADKGFVWSLGDQTPKVEFKKAAAVRVTDKSRFTVVDGADREIWGLNLIRSDSDIGLGASSGTHLDIINGSLGGKNPR